MGTTRQLCVPAGVRWGVAVRVWARALQFWQCVAHTGAGGCCLPYLAGRACAASHIVGMRAAAVSAGPAVGACAGGPALAGLLHARAHGPSAAAGVFWQPCDAEWSSASCLSPTAVMSHAAGFHNTHTSYMGSIYSPVSWSQVTSEGFLLGGCCQGVLMLQYWCGCHFSAAMRLAMLAGLRMYCYCLP